MEASRFLASEKMMMMLSPRPQTMLPRGVQGRVKAHTYTHSLSKTHTYTHSLSKTLRKPMFCFKNLKNNKENQCFAPKALKTIRKTNVFEQNSKKPQEKQKTTTKKTKKKKKKKKKNNSPGTLRPFWICFFKHCFFCFS